MKPILFNTEMVKAILEGRKTVTRRVIKPQPEGEETNPHRIDSGNYYFDVPSKRFPGSLDWSVGPYKPPFVKGDILWVRETWAKNPEGEFVYRTDYGATEDDSFPPSMFKWRPSIHMPRAAARIFLRVTDVRAEPLQAMGHEDAEQEGCWCDESGLDMPLDKFASLWDRTIKPGNLSAYGWEANPWVWAIYFERTSKE